MKELYCAKDQGIRVVLRRSHSTKTIVGARRATTNHSDDLFNFQQKAQPSLRELTGGTGEERSGGVGLHQEKNCAREVIEKYRSGSIRKSRVFFNIISALLFVERTSGLYYIWSRRKRERWRGRERKETEKERKKGIRIRAWRTESGGRGANTKTERGNEAALGKKKSEIENGNNVPTDQRGWTVTSG